MIVNSVEVDGNTITVGATDLARWNSDRANGWSGADARTSVWVTLEDLGMTPSGDHWALSETMGLHCPVGDPHRGDSLRAIPALLNIAHCLKNGTMRPEEAFGLLVG